MMWPMRPGKRNCTMTVSSGFQTCPCFALSVLPSCPALPCPALPCPALPCPVLPHALTNTYSIIHTHDMSLSKECRECNSWIMGYEYGLFEGSNGKARCFCPLKRRCTAMWCCCTTTCQCTPAQTPIEARPCPCGTACKMLCCGGLTSSMCQSASNNNHWLFG